MGVIRWGRVVGTTSGPKGQSLLYRNVVSGFSEARNPDFCIKALDFRCLQYIQI